MFTNLLAHPALFKVLGHIPTKFRLEKEAKKFAFTHPEYSHAKRLEMAAKERGLDGMRGWKKMFDRAVFPEDEDSVLFHDTVPAPRLDLSKFETTKEIPAE